MLDATLATVSGNKSYSVRLADGDFKIVNGYLKAFVLRFPDGSSEIYVVTSIGNAANKPSLIEKAFASVPLVQVGQRWGLRTAAAGAALGALASALWRLYGPDGAQYYCDSSGKIVFHGPLRILEHVR